MAIKNKIVLHTYRSKDDSKLAGVDGKAAQAEIELLQKVRKVYAQTVSQNKKVPLSRTEKN